MSRCREALDGRQRAFLFAREMLRAGLFMINEAGREDERGRESLQVGGSAAPHGRKTTLNSGEQPLRFNVAADHPLLLRCHVLPRVNVLCTFLMSQTKTAARKGPILVPTPSLALVRASNSWMNYISTRTTPVLNGPVPLNANSQAVHSSLTD